MRLSIWDILDYLNKWKGGIAEVLIISLLLMGFYIYKNQTYSAVTFISYADQNAKSGLTPNGKSLDVNEITSPNIIAAAIADLGITESVEKIRSRMSVSPIIPDEIVALKQSKTKEGEEYIYYPVDYSVKFTVENDKDGAYARDVVDAVIKHYSIYYSETYLNNSAIAKIDFDSDINNHDYLEVAEVMDSTLTNIISYLEERYTSKPDFRSSATGKSLADLSVLYKEIKNNDLPALFSNILNAQITDNKEALLKKYTYRKEQYELTSAHKNNSANVALSLIERFVESNKSVPNAYKNESDNEFDTAEIYVQEEMSRTKTTYDSLFDSYVSDGVGAGASTVDADYCNFVITAFSTPVNETIDYENAKANANKQIEYISGKMSDLYQITYATIQEYNDLRASQHIVMLSGINIINGISVRFYLLLTCCVGLLLGVFLAIVIEIILNLKKVQKSEKIVRTPGAE